MKSSSAGSCSGEKLPEDLRDEDAIVLGVEQEQHQGIRTRGAEGGQVDCTGCDPQALKLEDCVEACDAG